MSLILDALSVALLLCFWWLWRRAVAKSLAASSRSTWERPAAARENEDTLPSWAKRAGVGSPEQIFQILEEETLLLSKNDASKAYVVEHLEEDIEPGNSDAVEDVLNRTFEVISAGVGSGESILNRTYEVISTDIGVGSPEAEKETLNRTFVVESTPETKDEGVKQGEEGALCLWMGKVKERSFVLRRNSPALCITYHSRLAIAPASAPQRNVQNTVPRMKRKRPTIYMTRTSLLRRNLGKK